MPQVTTNPTPTEPDAWTETPESIPEERVWLCFQVPYDRYFIGLVLGTLQAGLIDGMDYIETGVTTEEMVTALEPMFYTYERREVLGEMPIISEIRTFATASIPPGWFICDGQVLPIAGYPDLYDVIGTSFNTGGEASGFFRLPNLNRRFPMGVDWSDPSGSFGYLASGGEQTHILSVSEMPAHAHTPGTPLTSFAGQRASGTNTFSSGTAVGFSATTGNTGGGNAHNNMPPFLGLPMAIYAGGV